MSVQFLLISAFGLFTIFLLIKYEGRKKKNNKLTGRGGDFDF